jgi:copper(I)-binding protein
MQGVYRLLAKLSIAGMLLVSLAAALPAAAQVNVTLPWVRATTQKNAAVFLQLEAHAAAGVALTGASSPIAKSVAIVEPRRHPGGTDMHPVPRLEVAAGSKLELKPGKPQLMLTGLTQPLIKGGHVPLSLNFETAGGPLSVDISAEVEAKHAKTAIDHEYEHDHEHDHQH